MRYDPPHNRCIVCSPRFCRPSWLYVAHDLTRGLTKIGKSVNVSARFQYYRRETRRDIRLVAKWQPSCDWIVLDFEAMAQARLPQELRVNGDWYSIEPDTAVRAVQWVAGGLS